MNESKIAERKDEDIAGDDADLTEAEKVDDSNLADTEARADIDVADLAGYVSGRGSSLDVADNSLGDTTRSTR